MDSDSIPMDDFWWLPQNVSIDSLSVGVEHHSPLADEDDPVSIKRFHSLCENGPNFSQAIENFNFDFLNEWRIICQNTNVYRTLKVFDCHSGEPIFLGPFLIDIDNSAWNNGYKEDLNDARDNASWVIKYLTEELGLSQSEWRLFFSGRKGFNIEVSPQALGLSGSVLHQIKASSNKLDDVITFLRKVNNILDSSKNLVSRHGTVIDRIYGDRFSYGLKHPYLRLHNSISKWIQNDGSSVARMKIKITIEELRSMRTTEITSKAEELSRMCLST